jgi:sulfide:quinone oxidoreductase
LVIALGNRLRNYLYNEYKGGPIAITSDVFHQGKSNKLPQNLPVTVTACEGPPVELAFSFAHLLEKNQKGSAAMMYVSTPAKVIAEGAGEPILHQLLPLMTNMGYRYQANTNGIRRINDGAIESGACYIPVKNSKSFLFPLIIAFEWAFKQINICNQI